MGTKTSMKSIAEIENKIFEINGQLVMKQVNLISRLSEMLRK